MLAEKKTLFLFYFIIFCVGTKKKNFASEPSGRKLKFKRKKNRILSQNISNFTNFSNLNFLLPFLKWKIL